MRRLISLGAVVVVLGIVTPARAWEAGKSSRLVTSAFAMPSMTMSNLIAHREANPDVDEAVKGTGDHRGAR